MAPPSSPALSPKSTTKRKVKTTDGKKLFAALNNVPTSPPTVQRKRPSEKSPSVPKSQHTQDYTPPGQFRAIQRAVLALRRHSESLCQACEDINSVYQATKVKIVEKTLKRVEETLDDQREEIDNHIDILIEAKKQYKRDRSINLDAHEILALWDIPKSTEEKPQSPLSSRSSSVSSTATKASSRKTSVDSSKEKDENKPIAMTNTPTRINKNEHANALAAWDITERKRKASISASERKRKKKARVDSVVDKTSKAEKRNEYRGEISGILWRPVD